MPAKATQITDLILATLQGIRVVNGFATDAGLRAYRGDSDKLDGTDREQFPMILLRTSSETLVYARPKQIKRSREITIEGLVKRTGKDYEPELDALAEDLYLALAELTAIESTILDLATDVEIAGSVHTQPEGGSALAGVTLTLNVGYVLTKT